MTAEEKLNIEFDISLYRGKVSTLLSVGADNTVFMVHYMNNAIITVPKELQKSFFNQLKSHYKDKIENLKRELNKL